MVTNRTGLGVHDVVVRYRVTSEPGGYTTPAKRPLFSWATPKRPPAPPSTYTPGAPSPPWATSRPPKPMA